MNTTRTTGKGGGRAASVGEMRTKGSSRRMWTTLRLYGLIVCFGSGMVWLHSKTLLSPPLRESIIGTANHHFPYEDDKYNDARKDEDADDETPTDDPANYDDTGIHGPVHDETPPRTRIVNQKPTQTTQNQAAPDHRDQQDDPRPMLILHVGPPQDGHHHDPRRLKSLCARISGTG